MPGPLRTELSTVSLPPRERIVARRCAKAIRQGQPVSGIDTNSVRKTAKAPMPTLAATRERRTAALNVAYLDRPDGYHIKKVVRRPATTGRPAPVPYLTGQEDLPCSDDESDDDSTSTATLETVPEIFSVTDAPNANFNVGLIPAQPEDIDHDAEGETDDEAMEDISLPSSSLSGGTFDMAWGSQPNSAPQTWPGASAQANNLIGNASKEDLKALFDGLDNFPATFPNSTLANFPTGHTIPSTQNLNANIQRPGYFAMHQLHATVDNLQEYAVAECATQPPVVPVSHLQELSPIPPSQTPTQNGFAS
ncbi:hypothetical protein BDV93DRAFT_521056, partial [Ceratobasidium sp. AG-I]